MGVGTCKKQMRRILYLIIGLISWAGPTSEAATTPREETDNKACAVRRIYLRDMGNDPRHVNFRLFLEKWLSKKNFTIAKSVQDADAALMGKLSISSGNKYSNLTFKDAVLKLANGDQVWHGSFDITSKNAFGWLGRGHIENGAKRIAENIRAACK